MKWIACIALLLIYVSAAAETFDDRAQLAKDVEKTDEYKKYEPLMFNAIGDYMAYTMRSCFEHIKDPNVSKFTVVADVTSGGSASNVEVQPNTNISACFAEGFSKASFPKPPVVEGRGGFPIYIDMKITP